VQGNLEITLKLKTFPGFESETFQNPIDCFLSQRQYHTRISQKLIRNFLNNPTERQTNQARHKTNHHNEGNKNKNKTTSSVPTNGTEPRPPATLMPSPVPGARTILITLGAGVVTDDDLAGEMRLALKSDDKMSIGEFRRLSVCCAYNNIRA